MTTYNLYDPLQSAYKTEHSTETALIKISSDILSSIDKGQCTILASLDLSAAFDTVDHTISSIDYNMSMVSMMLH